MEKQIILYERMERLSYLEAKTDNIKKINIVVIIAVKSRMTETRHIYVTKE